MTLDIMYSNKSSALAEMGDRIRTKWAEKRGGLLCPFPWRQLGPHLTQCGLADTYLRTKWHLDPSNRLATIHQRYRQTGIVSYRIVKGQGFYQPRRHRPLVGPYAVPKRIPVIAGNC